MSIRGIGVTQDGYLLPSFNARDRVMLARCRGGQLLSRERKR